ncbi:uncharacterized protein [Apostichopus japonicus]
MQSVIRTGIPLAVHPRIGAVIPRTTVTVAVVPITVPTDKTTDVVLDSQLLTVKMQSVIRTGLTLAAHPGNGAVILRTTVTVTVVPITVPTDKTADVVLDSQLFTVKMQSVIRTGITLAAHPGIGAVIPRTTVTVTVVPITVSTDKTTDVVLDSQLLTVMMQSVIRTGITLAAHAGNGAVILRTTVTVTVVPITVPTDKTTDVVLDSQLPTVKMQSVIRTGIPLAVHPRNGAVIPRTTVTVAVVPITVPTDKTADVVLDSQLFTVKMQSVIRTGITLAAHPGIGAVIPRTTVTVTVVPITVSTDKTTDVVLDSQLLTVMMQSVIRTGITLAAHAGNGAVILRTTVTVTVVPITVVSKALLLS